MDLSTWTVRSSKKLQEVFGASAPLSQEALVALIHPEDMRYIVDATNALAQQRGGSSETTSIRYRICPPGQPMRYVQTTMRVLRDSQQHITHVFGVTGRVVDEAEHAEKLRLQALDMQRLLDRLNVATQAAGIFSWEFDLAQKAFVWIHNPMDVPALKDLPLPRYLEALESLIVEEDRAELVAAMTRQFTAGQNAYESNYRVALPGGYIRHWRSYIRVLRDGRGNAVTLYGATRDVTNEVQTTALLQRQAHQERTLLERLRIATQAVGIDIWDYDFKSKTATWQRAEDDEPVSAEIMQAAIATVHPEDRDNLGNAIRGALKSNTDSIYYTTRRFAGGEYLHYEHHGRLFFDRDGLPERVLGTSVDITKKVLAAEQLARQAEQLRDAETRLERASLFSSEGLWEWDFLLQTAWHSASFHTLLGYPEGGLPTTVEGASRLIQPEDLGPAMKSMKQAFKNNVPYEADYLMRTYSGELRWFRMRGAAKRDPEGRVIGMAGSLQNVHQQKLAEEALAKAQERFQRAINGTQDGLWELDIASNDFWCSPRFATLLGLRTQDVPPHTNLLTKFLHPDDVQAVESITQAHYQDNTPYDIEIRLATLAGTYRWYRARAQAERDAAGTPRRLSGSLQDITEARASRDALLHATEAAQAASRAKSDFLANVSHEIRTPMNGIVGMTGLLLETNLDGAQREYAHTIRSSADSLLVVMNDILDFSKLEAGRLHIERAEFDIHGLVEEVGSSLAGRALAKHLELVIDVRANVAERVMGDRQRVRQCLLNIVGNAVKFTERGEVVVCVSAVSCDGRPMVRFEVSDTGIGIDAETLPTLFQPFVQGDSSTTRDFGGTGLGLSIVRRLVEVMDGRTGVVSELGKGSRFWFDLPLEVVAAAQPAPTPSLGYRVLVVDANASLCDMLCRTLARAGYESCSAPNANAALDLLHEAAVAGAAYDLVLAQECLVETATVTLAQRISAEPELHSTRVVLMTTADRQMSAAQCAAEGCAGFLVKPVYPRTLAGYVDRALAHDAHAWHTQSQPVFCNVVVQESKSGTRNVLLVEDNVVNQRVAVRFLERLGCKVTVASNGREGVEACTRGGFDLVVMDLQMPVMDGLTATRHIRALGEARGSVPIVALTANAMPGQLERCLAAGMNAFLTKPIEVARLRETLARFGMASSPLSAGGVLEAIPEAQSVPVDLARLNEITDGDPEFTNELILTFIASGEGVLDELQDAAERMDRAALAKAAHKLKGASANIHALPLSDLARALEAQAGPEESAVILAAIGKISLEFARAANFLRQSAPPLAQNAG
jgi:PAS domain S-box-containing protein